MGGRYSALPKLVTQLRLDREKENSRSSVCHPTLQHDARPLRSSGPGPGVACEPRPVDVGQLAWPLCMFTHLTGATIYKADREGSGQRQRSVSRFFPQTEWKPVE